MCMECRQYPCHSQCPNATLEPLPVCLRCGIEIDGESVKGYESHCSECWSEWLKEEVTPTVVDEYVKANESSFLMNWWWEGLDTSTQLDVLRKAFAEAYPKPTLFNGNNQNEKETIQKEFAFDDESDLYEFLKDLIEKGGV